MNAKLRNNDTGMTISVHSTTDSPDSSSGFECWVDDAGNSYGQVQFGAPMGLDLIFDIETARARMDAAGLLDDYEEVLFYDWDEGKDHIKWLCTAPVEAIKDWCKTAKV